jgi:hypothetical protein
MELKIIKFIIFHTERFIRASSISVLDGLVPLTLSSVDIEPYSYSSEEEEE